METSSSQNASGVDDAFIESTLTKLRLKLLDLTGRNPLISFKHSNSTKRFVRVIDELPDELYRRLGNDSGMRFRSLGNETTEPDDEKTIEFRRALDAAKLDDADYLSKVELLGDDPGERALERLEADLRVRLREQLGMPPRRPVVAISANDIAISMGLDPSYDVPLVPANVVTDGKHTDSTIQTILFDDRMDATLARIREQVRLSLDEAGVNPLFCVFGFLEWYEDGNSAVPIHSPLLLFPLNIDRKLSRGQYQYTVRTTGERAQANIALAERLKRDFQIHLPPFEEEDSPEKYLASVQKIIERQRSWKIRRWITVGLFSFARIAMYQDLDPENWTSSGGLHKHARIGSLLAGFEPNNGEIRGTDGNEAAPHRSHPELDIPLISDADSSQLEAISGVLSGRSMVIEGPPGTGKSQTITNIIAAALAAGKSVLFVAEKMAALNVVRERLVQSQLAEFCLELHSTKAGRRETAIALAKRLGVSKGRSVRFDLDSTLIELGSIRERLSACIEGLASPAGNLGITVQQLLWRCYRVRLQTAAQPSEIDEIRLANVEEFTEVDIGRLSMLARQYQQSHEMINGRWGSTRRNPWCGVAKHDIDPFRAEDIVRRTATLAEATGRGELARQRFESLTGIALSTIQELTPLEAICELPIPETATDEKLLSRMLDGQSLAALEQLAKHLIEHSSLRDAVCIAFRDTAKLEGAVPEELVAMSDYAAGGGLGPATLRDAPELVAKSNQRMHAWQAVAELMLELAKRAGVTETLTPSLERALLSVLDLALAASPEMLQRRSPPLLAPNASSTLRMGQEKRDVLFERRKLLTSNYVLETPLRADELRSHAASMRAAPLIPFLSRGYRRGRVAFKSICRTTTPAKRAEMAKVCDEIALFKEELTAFEVDAELRSCLGASFKGLDTSFPPLIDVATWGDQIRAALAIGDTAIGTLANRLLTANPEWVQSVAALATHPQLSNLRKVCADPNRGVSIGGVAIQIAERAKYAGLSVQLAQKAALSDDVSLSSGKNLAENVKQLHQLRDEILEAKLAAAALGDMFQGTHTLTAPIVATAQHARNVLSSRLSQSIKQWLLELTGLQRLTALRIVAAEAATAGNQISDALHNLRGIAEVAFKQWIGSEDPLAVRPADLSQHASRCVADSEALSALIDHLRHAHEAREAGLGPVLDLLDSNPAILQYLPQVVARTIYQSLARSAISRNSALVSFTGNTHEGRRSQFCDLDRKLKRLRQLSIADSILQRYVNKGVSVGPKKQWTGLALVQNEASKQQGHIAIRELIDRAGSAMQQLMPCFMMSPLSVAQFLKPDSLKFDLVIMDEASQLRPEDAIGAIARGSQLVVVGDPKQLPPTNFFRGSDGVDDGDDGGSAADEQSVLDQALTIMRPSKRLKWHYRSQHPSLIAFSNKEFYNNELVLFPTPFQESPDFGVRYVHVPDGKYRKSVNPPEAVRVAAEAIEYVRKHPERSLGIVTMNRQQAERLSLEIDRLAAENEDFEEWRRHREESLEPFFVKNLENVQGDERDAIFISTVYGKDEEGNLHQRFQSIVNEGGERRLNVLFSRSKCQTTVFSSMDPDEIRIQETSGKGLRAFKGYLKFAKDGLLELPAVETGREPDSDFEVSVGDALRSAGFDAVAQIGVSGYFIDIGIRHPNRVGEFVLGVECDGATYHSSKSARDRDRLRQEILERLRWRIHRIWSLDWYRNPRAETERLVRAAREAIAATPD